MASGGGFSYKPNVNRNVTKKWRDAARPTYDDDEWGDDGYGTYDEPPPVPAPGQRPGWGGQMPPPNRSFTNPSPPRSTGRASFDRGDDRRYVSAGSGFDSAYPSTQQAPFPEPQHDDPPQQRFYAQHPALHVNTYGQAPFPPAGFRPSSRGQHANDAPFSAPGAYQRSNSGNRSNPGGLAQQPGPASPIRPDSRSSNTSSRFHPPRKSSLSQEQAPPPPVVALGGESGDNRSTSPPAPVKALPFIRPADIYKRFEEEKERERRSSESQRPSLELDTTRSRDSAASVKTATSDRKDAPQEDSDSTRRAKPTLDTVEERKSEYGLDNLLKAADPSHPSYQGEGVQRNATNASSVYTDRPDPVSASTADDDGADAEPSSAFSYQSSLPQLGRISVFDPQLTPAQTHTDPMPPIPSNMTQASSDPAGKAPDNAKGLNHQASLGYRSVVQQAFDESQNRGPSSPTSNTDTLPRSNSASTSDLSPIISRRPGLAGGPSGPPVTDEPIPEEPSSSTSTRPLSESTIKGERGILQGKDVPSPPIIQAGYRRDATPPSREANSPARQANIRNSSDIQPQRAVVAAVADDTATTTRGEDEERGRPREPSDQVASPSASQVSGVSEEYNQWQAHSKQFNNKFGLSSNPATPNINAPITRAESPPKGTVRDLAGKYESNSGRSTPVTLAASDQEKTDMSRPAPQERLDSFRPALPGGWQSFATTPDSQTPRQEKPPLLGQQVVHESTDSIPTATAPKSWEHGPSTAAFAAAAAAGTALAGSFNGPAMTERKGEASEDESENEWDQSSNSSRAEPNRSATHDFATSQQPNSGFAGSDGLVAHSQSATLPDMAGKDTPSDNEANRSNTDYFPAPLRTSRSIEPSGVLRPPIPSIQPAQASPVHDNNEKLQEDIVKSLTPRSSNFEGQPSEEAVSKALPMSPVAAENPPSLTARESDDMYGGGSGQRTPAQGPGPQFGFVSGHQPQYSVSSIGSAPQRPFLEQRFSWEMDKDGRKARAVPANAEPGAGSTTPPKTISPGAISPETIKAPQTSEDKGMPVPIYSNVDMAVTGEDGGPDRSQHIFEPGGISAEDAPRQMAPAMAPAMAPSGTEAKSFRAIMDIGSQQDRIKAFEDNRATYSQSDGGLDQWIQSMQQVPEHANIFESNGRIWKDTGKNHNSSRQPSTRPMASITGSKIMQEDRKRLVAAAGRFGGKAGVAAKGLFAKGKDKLRSTSTSDKTHQTKRKSDGPPSTIAEESESKRNSAFPIAPQLPEQDPVTPMDESNWFAADRDTSSAPSEGKREEQISSTSDSATTREGELASSGQRAEPHISTRAGQPNHRDSPHITPPLVAAIPAVQIRTDSTDTAKVDDQDTTPTAGGQLAATNAPSVISHQRKVSDLTDEDTGDLRENQLHASNGLVAPDDRRLSAVSAVSSASPSPLDASLHDESQRRVSPADPVHNEQLDRRPNEPVPTYEETAPPAAVAVSPTKEEEAAQDRAATDVQNDPAPSYEETPGQGARPQRIGPNAQIVSVANLSEQRRSEPVGVQSRPFSFEATESFSQAQQAYEQNQQNQNAPSQPLSPVSQTASKDLSQVSVEEVAEDSVPRQGRQSKSYSRPFGADPIGDHPAFRQADQPIDRSQMYSTEAPPANAPRSQMQFDRYGQQPRPMEEAGYRIPGPYGQEYRSPKPRQQSGQSPNTAFPRQPSFPAPGEPRHGIPYQPTNAQPQYAQPTSTTWQEQQEQPPRRESMGPPPTPEQPKAKKTFGAFLRGKTKPAPAPAKLSKREKESFSGPAGRPAPVTRGSRQDSVTSGQSSLGESRDVVGQLPPQEKHRNRLSRDVSQFGGRASAEPSPQEGKKKKRFSAMGNLFSRTDKSEKTQPPQRATTLPSGTAQPDRGQYQYQYQEQEGVQQQQQHDRDSRYQQQQQQQQYGTGRPAPAEGYFGGSGSPQPQTQQGHASPRNPQHAQQQSYQVASPQVYESRPSDLRIDTSSGQGRSIAAGQPATAPVQSYSRSNNSYQGGSGGGAPYGSYSASAVGGGGLKAPSTRAPVSSAHSSIDPHVASLHKRSRSPTAGGVESPEPGFGGAGAGGGSGGGGGGTMIINNNNNNQGGGGDTLALPDPSARNSAGTPVDGLGTFTSKRISPVDGIPRSDEEQEAPFRIGIPGSEEEGRRRTRQILIEQGRFVDAGAGGKRVSAGGEAGGLQGEQPRQVTVAERMMNPKAAGAVDRGVNAASATRAPLSRGNTLDREGRVVGAEGSVAKQTPSQAQGFVAELPGSKAEGYESEEEVKMSATVKPGDWEMPVFV